jgi:hypothetical protein
MTALESFLIRPTAAFPSPTAYVNQPHALATRESHDMVITTNILMNRLSRRLKGNMGKYVKREVYKVGGDERRGQTHGLLSVALM